METASVWAQVRPRVPPISGIPHRYKREDLRTRKRLPRNAGVAAALSQLQRHPPPKLAAILYSRRRTSDRPEAGAAALGQSVEIRLRMRTSPKGGSELN